MGVLVNYWVSVKGPNDRPILRVNDRVFTWGEYVDVLKSQKLGAEAFGGQFNAGVAPYQLMQTLAENELIRQAAVREGLRVDDKMIRDEMISRLVPNPADPGDPGQISRELGLALSNYLATTQLSFSEYRSIVEADLLRNELRDKLGATIPRVQPQASLNLIRVSDPQTVDQVQKRLQSGEPFSRVARQVSVEDNAQSNGGAIGWVPRLVFPEFDTLIFGLREGQISDPITTDKGVWLIKLIERMGGKARLQGILVKNVFDARDARDRLDKASAQFADLSAEISIDSDLRAKRGDLGLVATGDFGGIFDRLIQGLPLDKISEPQGSTNGTVLLMVSDRTDAREVDQDKLDTLKTRALEAWLRREWDASNISYCPGGPDDCFSNIKVDKAIKAAGNVSKTNFERAATATAIARQQGRSNQLPPLAP